MSHGSKRTKLARMATAGLLAASSLVAAAGAQPAAAASCAGTAPSDFNGDGISDAAIGAFDTGPGHGVVHVIYGTRVGLTANASGTALDDQLLTDTSADDGSFDVQVATGDLNGDGCSDLAAAETAVPGSAGQVHGVVRLYYGSPTGLQAATTTLTEATAGITGAVDGDEFGAAMTMADFTGDGIADLAVGAPEATPGGAVFVFPGNRTLAPLFGIKRFAEGDGTVPGVDESGDLFGSALAAGDFNGDGHSDLGIGDPGEDLDKGAAFAMRGTGTSAMFTPSGSQVWTQDSAGIQGVAQVGDSFGSSLATGSFKGNGRTDLAVGVPLEVLNGAQDAGAVNVIYSAGATGLGSAGNQVWTPTSAGLAGDPQFDWFGFALAAADFDGNGRSDLAIGSPQADVGGDDSAGAVTVLVGSGTGLTATGSSIWTQDSAGVPGTADIGDEFGRSLATLRVTSAARGDLLVGVPDEGVGAVDVAGAVELIKGSSRGVTGTAAQLWSADSTGIKGVSCSGCGFAGSVA